MAEYVPSGNAGDAPANASFVVMGLDGVLTQERVLTAGSNLTLTDGGANGNATLAVTQLGGGAFTQGSVIFAGAGGVLDEDNTNFFFDDTNDYLCIGHNTGSARLDLVGTNKYLIELTNTTNGAARADSLNITHADTGSGDIYDTYRNLDSSGSGNFYGTYTDIDSTTANRSTKQVVGAYIDLNCASADYASALRMKVTNPGGGVWGHNFPACWVWAYNNDAATGMTGFRVDSMGTQTIDAFFAACDTTQLRACFRFQGGTKTAAYGFYSGAGILTGADIYITDIAGADAKHEAIIDSSGALGVGEGDGFINYGFKLGPIVTNVLEYTTLLNITGDGFFELTPSVNSGTGNRVIDIIPSAALDEGAHWTGFRILGDALDPSNIDTRIRGVAVNLGGISLTYPTDIEGIRTVMPSRSTCAIHTTVGKICQDFNTGSDEVTQSIVHDVRIDASTQHATSDTHALDVTLSADLGGGHVAAVGTHPGIDPIHQHIGTYNAFGANYAGRLIVSDYTDNIDGQNIWVNWANSILVGHTAKFSEIELNFTTPATKDCFLRFYYYDTTPGWTQFFPIDNTNGARQDGTIVFNGDELTNWDGTFDPDSIYTGDPTDAGYWIMIVRNRVSDPGTVDLNTAKYLIPITYEWDYQGEIKAARIGLGVTPEGSIQVSDKYIVCDVFTAAGINACIDQLGAEGGEVYLPEGTYVCTDASITIDENNTTLTGSGWGTVLDWSAGQAVANACIYTNAKSNVTIRNLKMLGEPGGGSGDHLIGDDDNAHYLTVENCWLEGSDNFGMRLGGHHLKILNNRIDSSDGQGLYISDATGESLVQGNSFNSNALNAIWNNGSDYTRIVNNTFRECGQNGIKMDEAHECVVQGNTIILTTTGYADISLDTSDKNVITGNNCWGSGTSDMGIYLDDADNNVVQGNFTDDHDVAGIQIDNVADGNSIAGNLCIDTTPHVNNGTNSVWETLGDIHILGSNKELRFYEGANYVGFEAPALGADQIWVLPTTDSTGTQALVSDGGGTLSWSSYAGNHTMLDGSVHSDSVADTISRGSLIYGNATPKWDELTVGGAGTVLTADGTDISWASPAHTMLDGSVHSDSVADTVTRGSLVYGNATPKWDELDLGTISQHLESDGTDIAWVTNLTMVDGATIGQAAGPLLAFDDTNNYLEITGCTVGIGDTTPAELLSVVGSANIIQFKVMGAAAQGANIVEIENSAGADLVTIDSGGNLYALLTVQSPVFEVTSDDGWVGINAGARLIFDTTPAIDEIEITDCHVGIGQVTPTYMLHITGNATPSPLLRVEDNAGTAAWDFDATAWQTYVSGSTAAPITWEQNITANDMDDLTGATAPTNFNNASIGWHQPIIDALPLYMQWVVSDDCDVNQQIDFYWEYALVAPPVAPNNQVMWLYNWEASRECNDIGDGNQPAGTGLVPDTVTGGAFHHERMLLFSIGQGLVQVGDIVHMSVVRQIIGADDYPESVYAMAMKPTKFEIAQGAQAAA